MGKQFEFYSHKNDDEMIANTLRSVFGELLCVPHYKGDLSPFDICANDRKMYLTGKSFQQYISYYTHEYYDGTTAEVLDYVKSPVLEYRVPFQREDQLRPCGAFPPRSPEPGRGSARSPAGHTARSPRSSAPAPFCRDAGAMSPPASGSAESVHKYAALLRPGRSGW